MVLVLAILGLGVLMAVHEAGHFLLARMFHMRVIKFSIGFGPTLWSKKPRGSETTYQIGLLPFLAYVQIAGMNPHEEIEPDDKGSYANASWLGRFLTIVAGPLANYLTAVIAFFFLVLAMGRADIDGLKIGMIDPKGSAASAQVQSGDEVKSVAGRPVKDWNDMRTEIQAHKGQAIDLVVLRGGEPVTLTVTPAADSGRIGIGPKEIRRPVSVGVAAKEAVIEPPKMAVAMVVGLGRVITGKDKAELRGPVGIVNEAAGQIRKGWEFGTEFFVILSIYICVFNLIPFPALDGGRLAFLLYEFIARRRPDAKIEARVHLVGMLALLTLFIPLFFFEIWQSIAKLFVKS
ncbi:MAG: site-2 protease family protein [Deltaproteobacteria bacterium]|nr:site-2 protease family protein [Deltaproteobacteria bacterium]